MTKVIKDTSKAQRKIGKAEFVGLIGAEDTGIKVNRKLGPLSMHALKKFLMQKLRSSGGRPTIEGRANKRNKIPMVAGDWEKLEALAQKYADQLKTTPGQIAAAIIHQVLNQGLSDSDFPNLAAE